MKEYQHTLPVLGLLAATLATAEAATTVSAGSVSPVRGPDDLDLSGDIVYAVNFSPNDPDLIIKGVTFVPDSVAPGGSFFVLPNTVAPWQVRPNFGTSADADALEQVYEDIRWANAGAGQQLEAHFPVIPGQTYKVQVLVYGNAPESRRWDISVEGSTSVDEFTSLGISAPGTSLPPYRNDTGVVFTQQLTAGDDTLDVVMGNLDGEFDGGDRNAIWQGITVERIAPSADDTDGDGLPDAWEALHFSSLSQTWTGDPDGDGLINGSELALKTIPSKNDTDDDGLKDGVELTSGSDPRLADSDGDGLPDGPEVLVHSTNPLRPDSDLDGLTDGAEVNTHGTSPTDQDTDDDDYTDGVEVANGTNPKSATSFPLLSSHGKTVFGADAGEGLDLTGTFLHAFNVGTNGSPGAIRGVNFTTDAEPGISVLAPNQIPGWSGAPNMGDSPDDDALEQMLWSIRYGSIVTVTLNGLTPGKPYKLQLLFLERCCRRACDVYVDGELKLDEFAPYTYQSDFGGSQGAAAVIGFLASGTSTTIRLDGTTVTTPLYNDRSPLLCGVTLEAVTGADADGDGLDDLWEISNFGNLAQNGAGDPDSDGLTNLQENSLGTNPSNPDTDADGLTDGAEVATHRTNPRNPDSDSDGLSDQYEVVTSGTNPNSADTDSDGYSDRNEIASGTNPTAAASYPLFSALADSFTGADPGEGLDLSGTFLYAVNIGSSGAAPGPAGDALFTDDFQPGIFVNTINEIPNWFAPAFGDSPGDDNLEFVMQSIRWSPAPNKPSIDLSGLVPGRAYKLQLLFAEACCDGRAFDIEVEGIVRIDEFNISRAQGAVNLQSRGAVATIGFVATDDTLNIVLNGQGVYTPSNWDHNPTISALTLEQLNLPDTDGDSLPDAWEIQFLGNLTAAGSTDSDSDGRTNTAEYLAGTNPARADTDSDGLSDGAEAGLGTNPLVADTDGDDLLDGAETSRGTNPLTADTDGDTFPDAAEVIGGSNPLSPASTPAPATASVFTGGDAGEGLDLDGTFLYAFNFGTPGAAGPARDAVFTADNAPGIGFSALNQIPNWQNPDYGSSSADDAVEKVMQSIRWAGAPDTVRLQLANLQPGKRYKLQLLFPETGGARGFDVVVEGGIVLDEFFPGALQGPVVTQGALVTYEFIAHDSVLRIELDGNGAAAPDRNPILAGLTLEALPDNQPASLVIVSSGPNGVLFRVTGSPGAVYSLDYSPSLAQGTWTQALSGITVGPQGSTDVTDPAAAHRAPASGFWRLRDPALRPLP